MTYKVIYHVGDEIDLRTKALDGRLTLAEHKIAIEGESACELDMEAIRQVELVCLLPAGTTVRIMHDSGTLFVSVVWLNLFGYFAIVNRFATTRLAKQRRDMVV